MVRGSKLPGEYFFMLLDKTGKTHSHAPVGYKVDPKFVISFIVQTMPSSLPQHYSKWVWVGYSVANYIINYNQTI